MGTPMKKYTAIINFKIEIEAEDDAAAEYVASTALPKTYYFRCDTGNGKYLRGLPPVVFANEAEKEGKPEGYWRNR